MGLRFYGKLSELLLSKKLQGAMAEAKVKDS